MNSKPLKELSNATAADALKLIEMALIEDTGAASLDRGVDCTTDAVVPKQAEAKAAFVARDSGVVCGVEVAKLVMQKSAPQINLMVEIEDGSHVEPGQTIAVMSGSAHDILTVERTCLNFMCRLSGISTLTRQFAAETGDYPAQVLDTRKTTPGWRRLEKYAVVCGGGTNHRMGLYDAIMLKDNHLAFYRSLVSDSENTIPESIELARNWINENADNLPNGKATILQLEVDTLDQLAVALETDCDIILLDNMTCDQLREAVDMRNDRAEKILLEASGGVNLKTINDIASTGVDRISVGALTHSAVNFDIGLDWRKC
jgi:nicotinate-nucleotide pyrophosphorylase (carboxylating)